jgi:NADH-quinone oxidoreductase subunit J
MGETILYIVFVTGLLTCATGVVLVRTPIHSLLLLIMVFFNTSGLFLVWGAEFLAMMLIIVYVGAVAVLFLFVVMMLDVDPDRLKFKLSSYTGFSAILALILFVELIIAVLPWKTWEKAGDVIALPIPKMITNTHLIGNYLYTQYFYIFQISGLLLLLAMIGAILLTLRERRDINHQNISKQVSREPTDTITLIKVPFRQGVNL